MGQNTRLHHSMVDCGRQGGEKSIIPAMEGPNIATMEKHKSSLIFWVCTVVVISTPIGILLVSTYNIDMPGTTTTTLISPTSAAPVFPGTCQANLARFECEQGKDRCNHAAGFRPEYRFYKHRLRCCCKCCKDNVCGDLVC